MHPRYRYKLAALLALTCLLPETLTPPLGQAAAEEGATLALIDELVIRGAAATQAELSELSVRQSATGQEVPGRTGSFLAAGDEVRTGPETRAVLRFLDTEAEVEPWLFIDENSLLRIVDQRSVETLLGRLFATLKGLFTVLTPQGQLGVEGTEVEVFLDPGGGVDVQVLEGFADFRPGLPEASSADPSAATGAPFWTIKTTPGERSHRRKTVTLSNPCKRKHKFTIDHGKELAWLDFSMGRKRLPIAGLGKASTELRLTVDAARTRPGIYRDTLLLRCLDCHRDRDCVSHPRRLPLRVLVGVEERRITPLQRLELRPGYGTPSLLAMAEGRVRRLLDWTNDVLVAGQATYPAPGEPPYFATREDRGRALRSARFRAVWHRDPIARSELGKVYNDWGEGRRAVAAYAEAAVLRPELNEEPDFLLGLAQANRRAGRLDEAEARARAALERRPDSSRAHLTLGNVLQRRASVAENRGEQALAAELLNASLLAYVAADEVAESESATNEWRRQTRSVVTTNVARSTADLAALAAVEGDDPRAERLLDEVRDATRVVRASYPQDPFALLEAGAADQKRARLAAKRGDSARSLSAFEEAERQYREALDAHPDLAAGHYRLGTLWVDRGPGYRDRAVRAFEQCIATRPTYAPAYYRLGLLAQDDDPAAAARYFDLYRKLTPDALEKPLP